MGGLLAKGGERRRGRWHAKIPLLEVEGCQAPSVFCGVYGLNVFKQEGLAGCGACGFRGLVGVAGDGKEEDVGIVFSLVDEERDAEETGAVEGFNLDDLVDAGAEQG